MSGSQDCRDIGGRQRFTIPAREQYASRWITSINL